MTGDKFICGLLIIGLCLLAISLAGKGINYLWDRRDGICICDIPPHIIEFRVIPRGDRNGCFRGTILRYELGYKGTYDVSGDVCTQFMTVPEEEYYHQLNKE